MPPLTHAKLAPSASERWLTCPASIRMEAALPEAENEAPSFAIEGSAAHDMGEIKASLAFGLITPAQFKTRMRKWHRDWPVQAGDSQAVEDIHSHTDAYVAFLQERVQIHQHSAIMLEQRLETGVPSSTGTSDAVIVSPKHVEIVDLKYGQGHRVSAAGNPQLRLYGLGALDAFDGLLGDIEEVTVTIFQPRLDNISWETMHAPEIRAWRDEVIPVALSALGDDAPFGPSPTACQWCPASGLCRAQLDHLATTDFASNPEILSMAEVAVELERIPLVKTWLAGLERHALSAAYTDGLTIPGWKVVLSGGRRTIPDAEGAIEALVETLKCSIDDVATRKLKSLGELAKLFPKGEFDTQMADYLVKTEGKPSLVPESDRRKPVTNDPREDFLIWEE